VDLRQLEYVVAIARTGSFTAAAAECHVSQSALSHQVARLEAQLGVRLFDRSSRSIALTEAGLTVLPYAARALSEMEGMGAALAALAGQVQGRVRIGLTQSAERIFSLAVQVAEFRRGNPGVVMTVEIGPALELIEGVSADDLDLAYAAAPERPLPGGVTFTALVPDEPLVAVVPAGSRSASLEECFLSDLLRDEELIEFRPPSALRARTAQLVASAGARARRPGIALGSVAEMVRFAAAGMGVAVVPRVFVQDASIRTLEPPPHVVRLLDSGASLAFGVYSRGEAASIAVMAFTQQTTLARGATDRRTRSLG
jgi:DNA-binding transcriptional LysR family regulator